jgi:LytR cell envelope-related transcriptional attenuator
MTFKRVRALIFVAVLFVTAGVVVILVINRDTQTRPVVAGCAPDEIPADIRVRERDQVTINVYNGTDKSGLAEQIGAEFRNRGFQVAKAETAADGKQYDRIAVITYGPSGIGAAWLVSAYFLAGEAESDYRADRPGDDVDVVLGAKFQQLATSTEVNQRIADMGSPRLEPGTCEATFAE